MNTLTPNCQVKIALLLQGNTVLTGARGQKRDRIFDKGNNRALNQGLGITLSPHWPISSSEDQLVNPYDLFAVNTKYILCLGQRPQFH